jgi:hypothetical protein
MKQSRSQKPGTRLCINFFVKAYAILRKNERLTLHEELSCFDPRVGHSADHSQSRKSL